MMTRAAAYAFRPLSGGGPVWLMLAAAGGVLAAVAPLPLVLLVFGGAGLLLVTMVEPVLALLIMLILAPLKTLIATESSVALPADVGQLTFALAVFMWLVWRVIGRRHAPFPRAPLYVPLGMILAGFGLSLFVAWSFSAWASEYLKWIEIGLLVVVALDFGVAGRWSWIVFGLVIAAVVQALVGLYEFTGGSGAPHLWIAGYTRFRAFGTFGQPNPFSAFMGLTLPLALGMAWGYGRAAYANWRRRTGSREWFPALLVAGFYGLSGLILLGGLLAAWGRGAWLGFGAAVGVMVFLAPRRLWHSVGLLGVAAVLVIGLWSAGLVPASVRLRVTNTVNEFVGFGDMRGVPISDENFAIVERLAHWQAAYDMASDHSLLGVGLGNYEAAYARYGLPSWPRALGHAHNDYLNLLAETGVVGLTCYLAAWGMIGWLTLRALRQSNLILNGMVLGLAGTWTHLAVHSLFDKLYVNNLFLHIGVMLGLLAVAVQVSDHAAEGK